MGFEPTTPTLARLCSTPELRPRPMIGFIAHGFGKCNSRSMAASPQDLFRRLRELGIATTTAEHPPVFTVEEAKALRGQIPGCHIKNLFLKDKRDQLWLVVCPEDRPIELKNLPGLIGSARLSFARPELLREVLGVEPGSVTPFALINDTGQRVAVILDAEMMQADLLNCHPLHNSATTTIGTAGLLDFIRACGHTPRLVALGRP
jgi:Ala-tRNA(Pro) deacylase